MLIECYVIHNGINSFHYSVDGSQDDDHFVLSSGFLAAMNSFSEEVRSSKIDFFASESEIFMFEHIDENTQMVLVFENKIQQSVAREVMRQSMEIIKDSSLLKDHLLYRLESKEEQKLRDRILNLANSLISPEFQAQAADELVNSRADVNFLQIYDYSKDEMYYDHTEWEVDQDEVEIRYRALPRVLIPLVKECRVGQNFDLISIDSIDYQMVIGKYRTILTTVISTQLDDPRDINNIPFRLKSLPEFDHFEQRYRQVTSRSRYEVRTDQTVKLQHGDANNMVHPSYIIKFIDEINLLLEKLELGEFNNFTVYGDEGGYIRVDYSFTADKHNLEIYD